MTKNNTTSLFEGGGDKRVESIDAQIPMATNEQLTLHLGKQYEKWEKSNAVKLLETRMYRLAKEEHPTLPLYAIPKMYFEDKTANGLQKCIIVFLQTEGWQAERINVMGRPLFDNNGKLKKWITGQGTKGSADISATIQGRSVKIEVKVGRDRQRPDQLMYQQMVERAGGVYVIARTFSQFVDWYNAKFVKNEQKGGADE